MIRSTLSVSAGLAVVAVTLSSLWIGFGPRPSVTQDKRVSAAAPLSQQSRSGLDANGQTIRTITPGLGSRPGMVGTSPTGPTPSTAPSSHQSSSAERPADSAPPVALRTEAAPAGANDQATTAGGSVDLNTASVEQLNALGAGMIGKRIIEFRPYLSPDELLTRRVLKRSDYDMIKGAITAR
jgi:hypothetical protein